jgi:glycosyltransferase involved in cell wall biosynthesis
VSSTHASVPGGAAGVTDLTGTRLCFLNWRDRTHPEAGGAEVYCEELAQRCADAGAEVTLLTAAHHGAPAVEERGGITIRRRGGTLTVYLAALLHLLRHRRRYDAVVDLQNGIPFFAPLVTGSSIPVILVVHHVHQDQFRHRFPWPLSAVGRWLESSASRRIYGTRPVIAVSPSTRADVRLRLGLRGPIHIVPNGVEPLDAERRRSVRPTIAIITRLVPHKRLPLLVEAVADLRERWPDLHLHIGGRGSDADRIARTIDERRVSDHVTLHGFVSDDDRADLLAAAWLTALPSEAEGWGLTILEAASLGVPAVGLHVPGVRDAIVAGSTGWLAASPEHLTDTLDVALTELADADRADRWARSCREWAGSFSWDRSFTRLSQVLAGELRRDPRAEDERSHRDLGVTASFDLTDEPDGTAVLAALRVHVRATDDIRTRGGTVDVVLHGADEALAQEILRRCGVQGPLRFAVLRPHERLSGLDEAS